jgi:hypothetical protein
MLKNLNFSVHKHKKLTVEIKKKLGENIFFCLTKKNKGHLQVDARNASDAKIAPLIG